MTYTIIDNAILECKELNIQEQSLLIALWSFNNKEKGCAWPSYKQLMVRSKIKKDDTLIKTIKSLENKKYIEKITNKGKGNRYFLLPLQTEYPQKQGNPESGVGLTPFSGDDPPHKWGTTNTNTNIKTNTIIEEDILKDVGFKRVIEEYKNCISIKVTNKESTLIKEQFLKVGEEFLIKAFEVACNKNGKNIDYVLKLISDWERNGLKTVYDIEAYLSKREKKRQECRDNNTVSPGGKIQPTISNNMKFNNFEQRVYDYNDLERKLLGWDN